MDEDLRKDVFAWFGAAYYAAQCFEIELCILLILAHRFQNPEASVDEIDELDRRISRRTLGWLVQELSKRFLLHPDFEELLGSYLDKRNYLAHRFFSERASDLLSRPGCREMVSALQDLYASFKEADEIASTMSARCRNELGINEDALQQEVEEFLARAREPDTEAEGGV